MLATGWLLASGEAYRAHDIFGAWFCGFFFVAICAAIVTDFYRCKPGETP